MTESRAIRFLARREAVFWAALASALGAAVWIGIGQSHRASNERHASAALKRLVSANADFIGHDRDGNGKRDFWAADVASLYDFIPPGAATPLRLIPAEVANADPRRPGATPYRGYWFVAMETDEEGKPYAAAGGDGRSADRKFGFCAYPARYGITGETTFIINESNVVYKQELKGKPRLDWPTDAELKSRPASKS